MATLDDVRRLALALPRTDEAVSWGSAHWRVSKKGFVWERPLRRSDEAALEAAGVPLPDGDVLGARSTQASSTSSRSSSTPIRSRRTSTAGKPSKCGVVK